MTDNSAKIKFRLIADIGGTNARFALLKDHAIQNERVLKGADYPDFVSACSAYLSAVDNPEIHEAAIAIANPIEGDQITMTNHDWAFSIEDARQALGLDRLIFKNDFAALALSVPLLARAECHQVGGGMVKESSPIGVLGPGTGLGVSGLIPASDKWLPVVGEGGHVSISPANKRECEVLEMVWKDYQHVSAERLISGTGLQRLYRAICQLDGVMEQEISDMSPRDISAMAINKSNKRCEESLDMFCSLLGTIAGNLALTLGAKGGIYIGGGIIPKLGSYFDDSPFRQSFEKKGRFADYLGNIPVFVIQAKHPALIGISQVFDQ